MSILYAQLAGENLSIRRLIAEEGALQACAEQSAWPAIDGVLGAGYVGDIGCQVGDRDLKPLSEISAQCSGMKLQPAH